MPEKIGPYTVVSQIGRGGMGIVYKARDESLNRFVAIKVLSEQLTEDATVLQRFVREAQAAAGLSHPNIVQIYYIGDDNGHPYFVMEFVPGRSLDQMLRAEGRIDNPRASQLILQAAHGLAAAHDQGIIHRDIKPANLILDDRGLLKIADFGLALPLAAQTQLTATGMFVGTPGYLAPEQCAGEKVDNRTDIYALGVSFYFLLTGTPPFKGDSPLALVKQIMDAEPADVASLNPGVDAETRRILGKMIAKDRAQRYQNCHELIADLEEYLATRGVRSMTAGLATRTGSSAAALPGAASTPTQAIAQPAATVIQKSEPTTVPEAPLAAANTQPEPWTQPKRSSSRAAIVAIVLVVALLAGGAIAAVIFGTRMYRSFQAKSQETTSNATPSPATASTASQPPDGVLLAQTTTTIPPTLTVPPSAPAPAPTHVAEPKEKAHATPAAAQPARARSGVVIAATGDQGLSSAVSNVLRSELEGAGLEVVDANALPATEDVVRHGDVRAAWLIDRLRAEGYAALVLARIDPTGQRELSYYGRHDTLYSSRVTLTSYDLETGRPIGSSGSATIDYTSLNADSKSEEMIGPLAKSAANAIRSR